jgi:hypothetical protein
LDVFRGALDAQESALQNIKRAETLCEYILKLLARAKVRECEGLVLLADGSCRFTLVAKTKNIRLYEASREARIVYSRVDLYGNVIYLCCCVQRFATAVLSSETPWSTVVISGVPEVAPTNLIT